MNWRWLRLWVYPACVGLAGCSDPVGLDGCDSEFAIPLSGGSCITFTDGGLLTEHRSEILQTIERTYAEAAAHIGIEAIEIQVFAGTLGVIPEIGMGGRAYAHEVRLVFDHDSPVLSQSLGSALRPLIAHELHHVARHRSVGFGANLLGVIVTEGLADHFSMELTGAPAPPWAVALHGPELEAWTATASEVWLDPGPDLDVWMFGASATTPRWTGYSIGFDLVARYLRDYPAARASTLVGEPAHSFIPTG